MKFRVPQFIDVEDKIFGPFTFKQFIYLAGSGGLAFVIYKTVTFYLAIPLALALVGLGISLAFYKPNGKPFMYMIEAGFNYYVGDKLYVWKKNLKKKRDEKTATAESPVAPIPQKNLSESKLKDIAWSLDVLDLKNKGDGK